MKRQCTEEKNGNKPVCRTDWLCEDGEERQKGKTRTNQKIKKNAIGKDTDSRTSSSGLHNIQNLGAGASVTYRENKKQTKDPYVQIGKDI